MAGSKDLNGLSWAGKIDYLQIYLMRRLCFVGGFVFI